MYIIFTVDSVTKKETIIGHVGSNKYRAVAALRRYVDLELDKLKLKLPTHEKNLGVVMNAAEIAAVDALDKLEPGLYIITSNSGTAIEVYIVDEVEVGWFRSSKRKDVKPVLISNLRESKQLDILPKPANTASNHDNLLGELRGVLKTRKITV